MYKWQPVLCVMYELLFIQHGMLNISRNKTPRKTTLTFISSLSQVTIHLYSEDKMLQPVAK